MVIIWKIIPFIIHSATIYTTFKRLEEVSRLIVKLETKIEIPKEEETNNEDEFNINIVIQFVHTPRGDTF